MRGRTISTSSLFFLFLFAFFAFFPSLLFVLISGDQSSIRLTNNGYAGVVVAIHKDVPEDENLVEGIEKIVREGSQRLFTSTKKRAFFDNVTILIPPTWQNKPEYEATTKERFSLADIVVKPPNKMYGDAPYVPTYGNECGDAGQFIHLTPAFVRDGNVSALYGDVGRVLVHEWGHFRWGLKEEYPASSGETKWYFSTSTKRFEAVRCSLSMKGRIVRVTGVNEYHICKLTNGLPDKEDCQFFPGFKIDNPSKVSLMDRQGTKGLESFCEHGADEHHQHNVEAPNEMNRRCGGKSAWDVMSAHSDFANDANPPMEDVEDGEVIGRVEPTFKLVQAVKGATKCRLSLVLDVSGSMSTNDKLKTMNKGLQKLIRYTLPENTQIGVSTFDNYGYINCHLTNITDEASREDFIKRCLPPKTLGGTSIGSGLLKGVENLGQTRGGDRIILLTDGAQTTSPGPNHPRVVKALDKANVFVDSVCFTANADESMRELATKYKGNYYFDSDKSDSNSLNQVFTKNPCGDDEEEDENRGIVLVSSAGIISDDEVTGSVNIDASVGRETKFIFDYQYKSNSGAAGIVVVLSSPSGKNITKKDPEYEVDTTYDNIVVGIPDLAEIGRWKYAIKNRYNTINSEQTYKITILSKSRNFNDTEEDGSGSGNSSAPHPLVIHATMKATGVNYPSPMTIYAEATRGGDPVLGLQINATVDRPGKTSLSFNLPLLDNGQGADAKPADGVYSRYFTAFTAIGRYSFSIHASNPDGTAVVRSYQSAGSWGGAPAFDENNLRPLVKPTFRDVDIDEDVSRSMTAGVSELLVNPGESEDDINGRIDEGIDEIPPARVEDLRIVATHFGDGNVSLTWTATGDDYDRGRVNSYLFKIKDDDDDDKNATRATNVTASAMEAGETENMTLNIVPGGGQIGSFTITIIPKDEAGNEGEESNSVTAGLGYVPDIAEGKLPFGEEEISSPSPSPSTNDGYYRFIVIVVGGVVGGVLLVSVFAALTAKKRRHQRPSEKLVIGKMSRKSGDSVRLDDYEISDVDVGVGNPNYVEVRMDAIDATEQRFKYEKGSERVVVGTKISTSSTSVSHQNRYRSNGNDRTTSSTKEEGYYVNYSGPNRSERR